MFLGVYTNKRKRSDSAERINDSETIDSPGTQKQEGSSSRNRRCVSSMLNQSTDVLKDIFIFRNGNINRSGSKTSVLRNTCAFDSVVQLLACLYVDNAHFRLKVDNLVPTSILCEIISKMPADLTRQQQIARGKELNKLRDAILISTNPEGHTQFENNLITTDCDGNVNYTIERTFPTELYSYQRTKNCLNCGNVQVSNRAFLDLDLTFVKKYSIKELSKCINMELVSETRTTRKRGQCEHCHGPLDMNKTEFGNLVMIDTQTCVDPNDRHFICPPYRLSEIPDKLDIHNHTFSFVGCTEYIGEYIRNDDGTGIGHYVAHVKRRNNMFQSYDDTRTSKFKSPTKPIRTAILFYVR